ncbi:MAG: hypothetical protein D6715_12780 [Calditrichaeota bacterium]|nr:MAG: hypothetical protein D6715_12780 [Calditrichota bacterium]
MKWSAITWSVLILLAGGLLAQSQRPVTWKSRLAPRTKELIIFHSTMIGGLPTTETPGRGAFEFEVTHRFRNALGTGFDNFYGLDFGANTRIALGYVPYPHLMVALGRSSIFSNFDLWVKYRFLQWRGGPFPGRVALRGGVAWNTKPVVRGRNRGHPRNFQYYGQAIFNLALTPHLALALVPGWLYNVDIRTPDAETATTLGTGAQFYFARVWSVWAEAVFTLSGLRDGANALTFGLELETGGHFFKIFLSNSNRPNPSQYLAGAPFHLGDGSLVDNLVFGFTITRLLHF